MENLEKAYKTILRLRFRDQDVLGHANNAVYFTFFEDARADFLRDNGVEFNDPDVFFFLGQIGCTFKKPIVYDLMDPYIAIYINCVEIGEKSFKFVYTVTAKDDSSYVHAIGESVQVCLDPKVGKTTAVSDKLKGILSKYH